MTLHQHSSTRRIFRTLPRQVSRSGSICVLIGLIVTLGASLPSTLISNNIKATPTDYTVSSTSVPFTGILPVQGTPTQFENLLITSTVNRAKLSKDDIKKNSTTEKPLGEKTAKDNLLTFDAQVVDRDTDSLLAEFSDSVITSAQYGYPIPADPARSIYELPGVTPHVITQQPREGLQYFFPPNTDKQAYFFYDPTSGRTAPIDFQGYDTTSTSNRVSSQFTQYIFSSTNTPIKIFEPTEDNKTFLGVPLTASVYAATEHTLTVEPYSGLITNREETTWLFQADSQKSADSIFTTHTPTQSSATLVYLSNTWDEDTIRTHTAPARNYAYASWQWGILFPALVHIVGLLILLVGIGLLLAAYRRNSPNRA